MHWTASARTYVGYVYRFIFYMDRAVAALETDLYNCKYLTGGTRIGPARSWACFQGPSKKNIEKIAEKRECVSLLACCGAVLQVRYEHASKVLS